MQREDENIRILLRYALGAGNYLNGQSIRGGAFAFKLDIMSQLDDVKSLDSKSNLLMYIIEKAESDIGRDLYVRECNTQLLTLSPH
jgi:diaphanous 1